jgi:hypothetical protein
MLGLEVGRMQTKVIQSGVNRTTIATLCAMRLALCGTLVQNGVSEGIRTLDLRGHNPALLPAELHPPPKMAG